MYIGKMFNLEDGTLCKVIDIYYQKVGKPIYNCVNYTNGERFLMNELKKILK